MIEVMGFIFQDFLALARNSDYDSCHLPCQFD